MNISTLTPHLLREMIAYEPATGELRWRPRSACHFRDDDRHTAASRKNQWNGKFADKVALTKVNRSGYLAGAIFGTSVLAHRVAYAIYHGAWPDQVDHINGDPADNRIANLRSVDRSGNHRNRRLPKSNRSGVIGVRWNPKISKWCAAIRTGGRQQHLGSFADKSEAVAARAAAEREAGYHSNHGRRA